MKSGLHRFLLTKLLKDQERERRTSNEPNKLGYFFVHRERSEKERPERRDEHLTYVGKTMSRKF